MRSSRRQRDASDGYARGLWSSPILECAGIDESRVPRLVESAEIVGALRREAADRWALPPDTPIIGGAGDNMCGGVGAGVVRPGQAFISLGTSGVYFLANDRFLPSRCSGMHTHRHALPALYCQQGCILSAASALAWMAGVLGEPEVARLIAAVEAANCSVATTPVFTPYLSGERTPHNEPHLTATFSGLTLSTRREDLVHAVLEGVALAFADCHRALVSTGAAIEEVRLIEAARAAACGRGSSQALSGCRSRCRPTRQSARRLGRRALPGRRSACRSWQTSGGTDREPLRRARPGVRGKAGALRYRAIDRAVWH